MRRACRITESPHTNLELFLLLKHNSKPRTAQILTSYSSRGYNSSTQQQQQQLPCRNGGCGGGYVDGGGGGGGIRLLNLIDLFQRKISASDSEAREDLRREVLIVRDELVSSGNVDDLPKFLDEKFYGMCRIYSNGAAYVQLLQQLYHWPHFALEVLKWRRAQIDRCSPMKSEEYAKSIMVAGRTNSVDLAVELFKEATYTGMKTTSTYNALMGAYMYNGLTDKCRELFKDLKRETDCPPTTVTYNILISVYGRLALVDQMETMYKEMKDLDLSPTLCTYNYLIAGYLTAWMWDSMETTFLTLKASHIKPDLRTYLLILRGYAHSGCLEKMEKTYEYVKNHVNQHETPLIRSMICSYCKSSEPDRVKKIEKLLSLIPEIEYRPWLNVLLIKVYAQEDLIDMMENTINEAFHHKTTVSTIGIMRAIIATYYRYNDIEKLACFVKRAEMAGWRICRSLYHCKMVMYAHQNRLADMESVLPEMAQYRLNYTKKTFWIMYRAYSSCGEINNAKKVLGLMCKHGYIVPFDVFP